MNENEIGGIVVDCALKVHMRLGPSLLESVYTGAIHAATRPQIQRITKSSVTGHALISVHTNTDKGEGIINDRTVSSPGRCGVTLPPKQVPDPVFAQKFVWDGLSSGLVHDSDANPCLRWRTGRGPGLPEPEADLTRPEPEADLTREATWLTTNYCYSKCIRAVTGLVAML
jgi:hypothetical protein